jgi:hypothetical protein
VEGRFGVPDIAPPPEGIFDMLRLERIDRTLATTYSHPLIAFGQAATRNAPTCGLWRLQAMINHSCDPNAYVVRWGDVSVHRAATDQEGRANLSSLLPSAGDGPVASPPLPVHLPVVSRRGDKRNARRTEICEQLMNRFPNAPDPDVFEPLRRVRVAGASSRRNRVAPRVPRQYPGDRRTQGGGVRGPRAGDCRMR